MPILTNGQPLRGLSLLLLAICFLLTATSALSQKAVTKINCNPPRGLSKADEIQQMVSEGAKECKEAQEYMKEANALRDESSGLTRSVSLLRKDADAIRKQIREYRREAENNRKTYDKLGDQLESLQEELVQLEKASYEGEEKAVVFVVQEEEIPIEVTADGLTGWESTVDDLRVEMIHYLTQQTEILETEMEILDDAQAFYLNQANLLETRAQRLESVATRKEQTAIVATGVADFASRAAVMGQQASILHNLNASLLYVDANNMNKKQKRNVQRVVNYMEDHKGLLPANILEMSRQSLQTARDSLGVK